MCIRDRGINNITVLSDLQQEHTNSFEDNGWLVPDGFSASVRTSSPTARGQFQCFRPPGNICPGDPFEESYNSMVGNTFDYMRGMKNNHLVIDTIPSSQESEPFDVLNLQSRYEEMFGLPDRWKGNLSVFKYVDDTNGNEKLCTKNAATTYSTKKKKN